MRLPSYSSHSDSPALLGDEARGAERAVGRSFLAFHRQGEEPLRDDEISILNGVLELNNKHVEELMTPMEVRRYGRIGRLFIRANWHSVGRGDDQLG